MKNYQDKLFILTILFFVLGMINIVLSFIGLFCFIIPFILFNKYKEQRWCKYYCPRAGIFTVLLSKFSLRKKLPSWLKGEKFKQIVFGYFVLNILFATMSTIMVTLGRIDAFDYVRFLMAFRVPFTLPQFITLNLPMNIAHFSYRIYSMMFTSTVVGLILGFIYMPRTWCIFCPIRTLTTDKSNSSPIN